MIEISHIFISSVSIYANKSWITLYLCNISTYFHSAQVYFLIFFLTGVGGIVASLFSSDDLSTSFKATMKSMIFSLDPMSKNLSSTLFSGLFMLLIGRWGFLGVNLSHPSPKGPFSLLNEALKNDTNAPDTD